jgi:hypothetical protein
MNFKKQILVKVEVYFWKDPRTLFFYKDSECLKGIDTERREQKYRENPCWFSNFGIHSKQDMEALCIKVCTHLYQANSVLESRDYDAIAEITYRRSKTEESQMFSKSEDMISYLKKLNQDRVAMLSPLTSWPHHKIEIGDIIVVNQEKMYIVVDECTSFRSGFVEMKIPSA